MKTKQLAIAIAVLVFSNQTYAVVDQRLEIQGTNLVLSWPSTGNEYYLVQHRTTLDASTPWTTLTNNFPANGTNRTTLVIPCCELPPFSFPDVGGGTNTSGDGPPSPGQSSAMSRSASTESSTELWATQRSGTPVPLMIFPPGWDMSGMNIFEVEKPENRSFTAQSAQAFGGGANEAMNLSSGGCDCPDMGFFRVFHIPDFSASITNYTFDGPTFIPVDFADYRERIEDLEILLNGEPTDYAEFTSLYYDGQTNWGTGIYFDRIPNGMHPIQIRATLRIGDEIGEDTDYLVLSNLTRTITVDNQVTFTNWDDLIVGTNYIFKAQAKNTNTDWAIDIYDAFGNYVNGGSGHTSDGKIAWEWNLTDTLGNPRTALESDPFFDSYITFDSGASAASTTRPTPIAILDYPALGGWLVAFQNTFYAPGTTGGDQFVAAMNAISGGPAYRNVPVQQIPLKFGTNSYTQAERNESWAELKGYMFSRENRNLYYFGHGGAKIIGGDLHKYDTNGKVISAIDLPGSKAFLTSKIVRDQITFNKYGGARPYRFVWLDGCSTASGDWPDAFGINKGTNSFDYYTNVVTNPSRKRPSAFVGWIDRVGGAGWGTTGPYWNFHSQWMFRWYYYWNSETLVAAFQHARQDANWPPGGDNQLWGGLRIFGYRDLKMNQYNQKADWQGP